MDLNSLIIIDKVVNLGTFTAAAKELRMPKSNLSQKVKQLESDLGQAIFLRTTRRVALTDFGKAVLDQASPVFDVEGKLNNLSEQFSKAPKGLIKISAAFDVGLYLLESIIPKFVSSYDNIGHKEAIQERIIPF